MSKKQRLALALALALGSSHALALGLGNIEVRSGLNEPLVAEIPVLSASAAQLEELKVRLASPEAFARVGIERPALVAANLEFSLQQDAQGRPVVRITTPTRVRDPFLSLLIEVEWPRGRLLREYTVLLDPPVTAPMRAAPATAAPVVAATPARPAPAAEPVSAPATPAPAVTAPATTAPPAATSAAAPAPAAPARAPAPVGDTTAPVGAGQTLWSIAQQVRPQGIDTNQAMLALARANPDAFIDGNINRLKRGAVLRIPSPVEFSLLTAADAAAEVRQHDAAWRTAVMQPVGTTAATPGPERAPPAPRDSRLEVVPQSGDTAARAAQSGAAADAQGRELRADLARSREEVSALQLENRELQSRVADLERIDTDTRRLIELKDSQLAAAQRRLAELEAELQAARSGAAPASIAEPPPLDLAAPAPADPVVDADAGEPLADVIDVADEPFAADADAAAADLDAVTEPAVAETPAPVAAPVSTPAAAAPAAAAPRPAAPAARPWYMNPMVLGGAGVALIGLMLVALRRRREPEPVRQRNVADAYAAVTSSTAGATRDETAREQVLLDAIAEQPDDLSRHLELVRHYYEAGDESGFEGAAEAMYAQLYDPEDMAWKQVVAMGRELLPDHPLFAVTEAEQASFQSSLAEAEADHAFEAIDDTLAAEPVAVASAGGRTDLEWDASTAVAEADAPDFSATATYSVEELDRLAREQENAARELEAERAEAMAGDSGYDLDLGSEGDTFAAEPLDDPSAGGDEAAATKLELARAYLDMGDVEGARGMLEEVVGEGNPGQRSEAKRLLDEIR